MPLTNYINLSINGVDADMSELANQDIELNFLQNEPENWQTIQSSGTSISLPATKVNDAIFNTYYNTDILDLSPGQSFRNLMDVVLSINGSIPILRGKLILNSAVYTDKPEQYNTSLAGGNGDWITDMQNVTLWDCVNTTPHDFTVANIELSWQNSAGGGYDSDEFHDYVYAPVRYRQPWQYADPTTGDQIYASANIYMLRPSISIYWLIIRAFRALGYSVNSQFINTQYFRRLVMPWTWGDFYDLNSQLVEGISFKAAGLQSTEAAPLTGASGINLWTGNTSGTAIGSAAGSSWWASSHAGGTPLVTDGLVSSIIQPTGGQYIFTGNTVSTNFFRISDTTQPNGFDNFTLYSFDDTTGTMIYSFNVPSNISSYIGTNVTLQFQLNLMLLLTTTTSAQAMMALEYKQYNAGGTLLTTVTNSIMPNGGVVSGGAHYPDGSGYPSVPTVYFFTVPNVNNGDVIKIRLRALSESGLGTTFFVAQAGYLNINPSALGVSQWQYDSATQRFENINGGASDNVWQPMYSTIAMTGLVIQLGSQVYFQYYDAFRSYNFLDFLGGIVDSFDLEVSTDPITMSVTIEPFLGVTIPNFDINGNYNGDIDLDGYYKTNAINDWTNKQDLNKEATVENFSNTSRQIDYTMKQDGSDGGQNLWAARNIGIYLNNVNKPKINNTLIDNGIIAGVPGASRYMLPNRFSKGNVQKANRFFSSLMHYDETVWANITGSGSPAPQLPTIFPENINDSSASAITQVFTPKLAFYKGLSDPAGFGGWRWVGDPSSPYTTPTNIEFGLPYMFGVNYNSFAGLTVGGGNTDPVLSYCDQLLYDSAGAATLVPGLMTKFHLPRMAIMRNGQILHANMRLNLNDICNFGQRNCIKIGNGLFAIISINSYKPLTDDSCEVVMWRFANVEQTDIDNSYPSADSVINDPLTLSQYDLRYARLLLYPTDLPQVG